MKATHRRGELTDERRRGVLSDRRGVSEVLGAILVFALVLAVLVLIQVTAVPAANQQVEFEHDRAVQEDMQDLRTAIVESSASGEPRAASVALGVRYPPRLFLVNPGPVAGTLQTTAAGAYGVSGNDIGAELDLTSTCGTDDLSTKHLTYRIGYNEYRGNSVSTLENTVVIQDYENSETQLVKNAQILVRGNTINLFIIKGNASYSGINKESINFISGGTGTDSVINPQQEWSLRVPTTVDANKWADDENLLASELDSGGNSPGKYVKRIENNGTDAINVVFEEGKRYTLRCTVIGVNEDPGTNPTDDKEEVPDDGLDINPNHPGTITQERAVLSGCSDEDSNNQIEIFWDTCRVQVTFKNRDTVPRNFTDVRVNFYNPDQSFKPKGQSPYTKRPVPEGFAIDGENGDIGGPFIPVGTLSGPGDIAPGQEATYEFQFLLTDPSDNQVKTYNVVQGDYFVMTAILDDGSTETYFVGPVQDTGFKPTAEITDASVTRSQTPQRDTVTVDWAAEDLDGDLQSGSITVTDTSNPAKSDSTPISPSGGADSGTATLTINNPSGPPVEYRITLTVEDSKGNSVTVTDTVTLSS